MSGPRYNVIVNNTDDAGELHQHYRNPGWCIAFIRFVEPSASLLTATDQIQDANRTNPIMVIENDCIGVTINNTKQSFAKTCSLTMKAGEVYYPHAVSAGDWVFVWINNYQDDTDRIVKELYRLRNNPNAISRNLTKWGSGLKFVGRVIEVHNNDTVTPTGIRSVIQTINCQAFLELATSVYYTALAQQLFTHSLDPNVQQAAPDKALALLAKNGLDAALHGMGNKFVQYFTQNADILSWPQPDRAVAFYLIIAMGIQRDRLNDTTFRQLGEFKVEGIISDAIDVPVDVARIMGSTNIKKLWQLYNVYLGIQQYQSQDASKPWLNMAPITAEAAIEPDKSDDKVRDENPVFFVCKDRLKGIVPFYPTPWNNRSLWAILNEYLNPVVNELYTVLRADKYNRIRPSIMVREQPFSTALFDLLDTKVKRLVEYVPKGKTRDQILQEHQKRQAGFAQQYKPSTQLSDKLKKKRGTTESSSVPRKLHFDGGTHVRSMYGAHPRWVIDESMVRSVHLYTSEQNRVNFVQVWGANQYLNLDPSSGDNSSTNAVETARSIQLLNGNMVADDADIRRNGLRANVTESAFDFPVQYLSYAPDWAKMRADWLFNGHLRVLGRLTLNGIQEPICEGDNIEFRDMVFHIESVRHSALIQNGPKTFVTELTLSNGMLADPLNRGAIPQYLGQLSSDAVQHPYVPGRTDIQRTMKSNRLEDGDRMVKNTTSDED